MNALPDLEAPFDRAAALPDGLQRAALTAAVGATGRRLLDLQRWVQAWETGRPAPADALFGDPDAVAPLHALAAALDMPAACRVQATLVLACLHALLWHLDRLHDLQPRLTRAQAIAQVSDELAAQWRQQLGDWEQAQALQLLVARVEYDVAESTVAVTFHETGIRALGRSLKGEAA